jgi:GntR family transcriptional regulator, rspAB operon transcriptional repressor
VRGALKSAGNVTDEALADLRRLILRMEEAAYQDDAFALIEFDMAFHLTMFKLSGLEALEQILTRCTIHTHRSKLWAPGHERPLLETARRHNVLLERLEAGDARGLARAIGVHIDTIVTKEDR